MEAFSASSLELTDAALLGGGDDARDLTVADGAGGIRRSLRFLRRNLFWTVVVTLVAILAGGLAYLRTWPPLAIVQSGSMVPTIQIGDVVVLRHLDGPPRVGQIVVIHVPDAARARYGYPPVITHRIVKIARDGEITTKGDALKTDDPFTTPVSTVTEQVVTVIPALGRVFAFFTSSWGMMWLGAGVLLLLGMPLLDRHREREEDERATLAGVQAQLEALTRELQGGHLPRRAAAVPVESPRPEVGALVEQAA